MEPEGSLPHSQVPANCPYPELFSKLSLFEHSQLKSETRNDYTVVSLRPYEKRELWSQILKKIILKMPPCNMLGVCGVDETCSL
jgi:hypothetical protein